MDYSSSFKGVQTYFNTTVNDSDGSSVVKITGYDIKNGMYDFYLTEKTPQIYDEQVRISNFEDALDGYRDRLYWVVGMAGTLCLSFILKLLFNFCNVVKGHNTVVTVKPFADEKVEAHRFNMGEKVPIDKWQMMDIACAIFTMAAVPMISSQPL